MKKKQNKKVSFNPTGLSTKNYNPASQKNKSATAKKSYEYKDQRVAMSRGVMIAVIAVSVLLIAAIVTGIILLVINYREENRRVDYMKDDLSEFVTIDRDAYAGLTVSVNVADVTDLDIEHKVLQLLKKKKGELLCDKDYADGKEAAACADHASHNILNAGDIAYIWYRGYELDENGNRTEPTGTCNFYGTSPESLELGSGSFIAGFELGLLGHTAKDTSYFYKKTTGDVLDTDIVYLTGTCVQETGSFYNNTNIKIDLADPDVEKIWGVGIKEFIKEIGIGNSYKGMKELITADGDVVLYSNVKVEFTTTHEAEAKPITVKTVFPQDYKTESFRNKTIYFEIYIDKTVHYESAEYNDALIESMGFDSEKLQEFSGETLADKYKDRIRFMLESERKSAINKAVQEKLWDVLVENAVFHKLPKGDVQDEFDLIYYQLEVEYVNSDPDESFMASFSSLDEYLAYRLGLSVGDVWKSHLYGIAEDDIKERLVFMRVLQQEGLMPTEEEYDAEYRRTVESEYYNAHGKTREDFSTDELYQAALDNYEMRMKKGSGETYFSDKVYVNMSIDSIVEMLHIDNTVKNK